jgi:hypothetical protein
MSGYKILYVRAQGDNEYEIDVSVEEVRLADLPKRAANDCCLNDEVNALLKAILEKPTVGQMNVIKNAGWVSTKDTKAREKLQEDKYFILSDSYTYLAKPADPLYMSPLEVHDLASGRGMVLREITTDSLKKVLDKETVAEFNRVAAEKVEKEKQQKVAKEKRKNEKQQAKLEQAKNLLKKSGYRVSE